MFAALQRLEEAVDKLEAASGEKGAFLDELVMVEVLSELKEIAQRDGISCTCGSTAGSSRSISAPSTCSAPTAGRAMRIWAATASDIDDICCKTSWSSTARTEEAEAWWYTSASTRWTPGHRPLVPLPPLRADGMLQEAATQAACARHVSRTRCWSGTTASGCWPGCGTGWMFL